jgi:hypothetical protein
MKKIAEDVLKIGVWQSSLLLIYSSIHATLMFLYFAYAHLNNGPPSEDIFWASAASFTLALIAHGIFIRVQDKISEIRGLKLLWCLLMMGCVVIPEMSFMGHLDDNNFHVLLCTILEVGAAACGVLITLMTKTKGWKRLLMASIFLTMGSLFIAQITTATYYESGGVSVSDSTGSFFASTNTTSAETGGNLNFTETPTLAMGMDYVSWNETGGFSNSTIETQGQYATASSLDTGNVTSTSLEGFSNSTIETQGQYATPSSLDTGNITSTSPEGFSNSTGTAEKVDKKKNEHKRSNPKNSTTSTVANNPLKSTKVTSR